MRDRIQGEEIHVIIQVALVASCHTLPFIEQGFMAQVKNILVEMCLKFSQFVTKQNKLFMCDISGSLTHGV